jgi:hypothetical protein
MTLGKHVNAVIRLKVCSAIYLFESSQLVTQSVLVRMFVCAVECSADRPAV